MFSLPSVLGQSFSGAYQLGPLQGEAAFSFRLQNGDTILHGPFQMERGDVNSQEENEGYFFVKGNYADNIPHGAWIFRFGQFAPTGTIRLEDYQYRIQLDGNLHQIQGELTNGRYQGPWIHEVTEINNSQPGSSMFRSEVQFESGVSQLAIQIEDRENALLGRFLRNGLAHDVWTLYTNKEQAQHWHFRDGILEKIVLAGHPQKREVMVAPNFAGDSRIINLDRRYLTLMDVFVQLSQQDFSLIESIPGQLILQNSQHYARIQELLFSKKSYEVPIPFQVEVPYQALTDKQINELNQIGIDLAAIDSLNHSVMSSSSINIAKVADEEIGYWQAVVASLSSQYLSPIRLLMKYHDQDILQHIPQKPLWDFLWPDHQAKTELEIRYEILGSEISRPFSVLLTDTLPFLPGETLPLLQVTSSVRHQIDSISGLLDAKIQSSGDQDMLSEVEKQLIQQVELLDGILDSAQMNGLANQALAKVQSRATEELAKYSAVEDLNAKKIQADNALNCLTNLRELGEQVVLIPVRWELIQVEYTDKVWNNFTSTVMSEEVKRRITRSYRDVMIPHFLQSVIDELSCANADQLVHAFRKSHDRMYELRLEETSKLERKLKNENDPKVVMMILGIDDVNLEKS